MGAYHVWSGLFVLAGLTLFTTLNLALRIPSRVRIAMQFARFNRMDDFQLFVTRRQQYMLATAVLRSTCTLGLFVVVLLHRLDDATTWTGTQLALAFLVTLLLVLVFGVAISNAWAKYSGEVLIVVLLPFLRFLRIFVYPLIIMMGWFDPLIRRLSGVPVRDAQSYADELEQEILNMVSEGEMHGAVDEEEKEMIESVIELAETRVEEIMTPRTEIVSLPVDADYETVLEVIRKTGHSRIPVHAETIDKVLGVLYVKDLLRLPHDKALSLRDTMRKPLFVPESKSVRELLREFQAGKVHIAIVLDEYGGTAGLVTIEDILEELVGEIADEYEQAQQEELACIDDRTFEIDARMRIDDLNDRLSLNLPDDEDYETIGGYVFSRLGRIPNKGESCMFDEVGIVILDAEPRRIKRLRLTLPELREPPAEEAKNAS